MTGQIICNLHSISRLFNFQFDIQYIIIYIQHTTVKLDKISISDDNIFI